MTENQPSAGVSSQTKMRLIIVGGLGFNAVCGAGRNMR